MKYKTALALCFRLVVVLGILVGFARTTHAQSGNMLTFDGTANTVTVPHVFSESQFGYEFWFRPATVGTPMNVVVYSAANGPMQTFSHQVRLNPEGKVVFYVYRQDLLSGITIISNRTITAGEWIHVGVNWQDMVGGELYLDGVLEGSFNGNGVPEQVGVAWKSGINLHIGSAASGLNPFNGNIDEFRIWSGGVGPNTFHPHATTRLASPFPTGLTDYWNFDSATSGAVANVVSDRQAVQITSGATLTYSALPAFLGGMGTTGDPYQVGFAGQLNQVRNHRSSHFIQTRNIALTNYQSGAGWVPLATQASPFSGTYNGQGFTISGLTQSGALSDAGLFGFVAGSAAAVQNVRMTGVNINVTGNHVGALAGWLSGQATSSGSSVEGSISGTEQVGGLFGTLNVGTTLTTSYSLATVTGSDMVGGLVGQPFQATVRNVYSQAEVSATTRAGGLFGNAESSTLQNAWADATVTGAIRGQISGSLSGTISTSGLYFSTTSGLPGVGTGQNIATGRTPDQLRVQGFFEGWDFATIWQLPTDGTASYPFLRGPVQVPPPGQTSTPVAFLLVTPGPQATNVGVRPTFTWTPVSGATHYEIQIARDEAFSAPEASDANVSGTSFTPATDLLPLQTYFWRVRPHTTEGTGAWSDVGTFQTVTFEGSGTALDPYQVQTVAQLDQVRNFLTAHFIQTADLSLEDYTSGAGWVPIGTFASPFTGHYNGQYHAITHLTVSRSGDGGLFGGVRNATLENVRLVDVQVAVTAGVGALVGTAFYSTLARITVSGSVSGGLLVGGIAGYVFDGGLYESYSTATVTGNQNIDSHVGGLAGFTREATLNDLYSLADVTGAGFVGGVVGSAMGRPMSRVYADAQVSSTRLAGQIAGILSSVTTNWVYFSTDSGAPGHGNWDDPMQTINTRFDLPGGRTRDDLRNPATFAGFDFVNGWDIRTGGEASYPFLRSIPQTPAPGLRDTPGTPIPQAPAWSTTVRSPEFRWSVPPPVDGYDLEVSRDSFFTAGSVVVSLTELSTNTHTLAQTLDPGTYYWRVRATNSIQETVSAWSTPQLLVIVSYSAGNGSSGNPYTVSNAAELFAVREFRSSHFVQTAPIDLAPVGPWLPIGTLAAPFTGSYNGQRFEISGLTQSGRLSRTGLFGVLSGATVAGVNLTAVQIDVALDSVGAVAGVAMANALVRASSVEGIVAGRIDVGGLVGHLSGSNVITSYSVATVTGAARVGGLVGVALSSSGIQDAYSLATVRATRPNAATSIGTFPQTAGGIVGSVNNSSVGRTYADATITTLQTFLGGQIAGSGFNCTFTGRSIFNRERGNPGVGTPGTFGTAGFCPLGFDFGPEAMRIRDTYFGWDFSTVWQLNTSGSASYPYLRDAVQTPVPGFSAEAMFAGGDGTPGNPYQVATARHLDNVRHTWGSSIIQTADIDLSSYANWVPISWVGNGFSGSYNGQHFTIAGLTITSGSQDVGLFSYTSLAANFQNIHLRNVQIATTANNVGGLVGRHVAGGVSGSSVSGSISGGANVGGLVGELGDSRTVSQSFSTATVTGVAQVGGLVGYATSSSSFSDVYSLATVTATGGAAGGIVGRAFGGDITRAYADVTVHGTPSDPIARGIESDFGDVLPTVTGSYYNGAASPPTLDASLARTPEQLRQQATFAGWDFTNVWAIDGGDGTGSFPFLRVGPQAPPGRVRPSEPAEWDLNPGTSLSLEPAARLTFPHAPALNPATFTLELWVRPATVVGPQTLISSRREGRGYALAIDESGAWTGWTGSPTGGVLLNGGMAVVGTWTHLALVHTGAVARLYVNGRQAAEATSVLWPNLGADLVLGGLSGLVDEVRLWSVARSELDLQTWMHEMVTEPMDGLAFHLSFDEAQGNTLFDRSAGARWARRGGSATFSPDVPPAGTFIQGTANAWYFLSNPTPGVTLAQFLEPLWTQHAAGSDVPGIPPDPRDRRSNVFALNEALGVYEPLLDLNVPAVPGKGYLVRVFRDDVFGTPGTFPKRLSVPRTTADPAVDLPLQFTSTSLFAGFSLVGNPFPYTIDLSDPSWEFSGVSPTVYIYDQALNAYRTWNRSTGTGSNGGTSQIAPKQGFLMVASGENPLARASRLARAPQARRLFKNEGAGDELVRLSLHLERGERREETQVLIYTDDRPVNVREMSRQLEPLGPDRFMLYSLDAETGFKIEAYEFPATAARQIDLPVHVEASASGEMTIRLDVAENLDPTWQVGLLDTQTGAIADLRSAPTYTFSHHAHPAKTDTPEEEAGSLAEAGTPETARFRLFVGPRALDAASGERPTEVMLAQNYPNPFEGTTAIAYALPEPMEVRLDVYDLLGRLVVTPVQGLVPAGRHQMMLHAHSLPSGTYVYRLSAGDRVLTRTLTVLR